MLESVLPRQGKVLEIASGTGQHVCYFARAMTGIHWQPTEPGEADRTAIRQRIEQAGVTNVAPPLALDVLMPDWSLAESYDAVLCINMLHISPWPATLALLAGAARHLRPRGRLVLYGPYLEAGQAAQSNLDFDASLKRRNPEWGLRELGEVTRLAATQDLRLEHVARMPANNLTLVFERA